MSCKSFHQKVQISRLLQIIGLFCKRALQKRLYSAKETYDFKDSKFVVSYVCGLTRLTQLMCSHMTYVHTCVHTGAHTTSGGSVLSYFQEFDENGSRPHMYIHICATHIYHERWGAGVEYHFQEFNEPYAPS